MNKMRRPMVAGNWKMNGTRERARTLVDGIVAGLDGLGGVDVVVCPPYVLIEQVARQLGGDARIGWGAQDVDTHEEGAFTGAVSAPMLRDFDCTYAIVGHSERRSLYGEDDATVAAKFQAAQAHGLIPILCVGELLEERESGRTEEVVARQLDAVVELNGVEALARAVVAYEPVWAIGTGRTATPAQAQEVHAYLRERIASRSATVAGGVRILYGGSVKSSNAAELFGQPDVDGGLIGGASLVAGEFLGICRAAAQGSEN